MDLYRRVPGRDTGTKERTGQERKVITWSVNSHGDGGHGGGLE